MKRCHSWCSGWGSAHRVLTYHAGGPRFDALCTQEVEAGTPGGQGHPLLSGEFQASMGLKGLPSEKRQKCRRRNCYPKRKAECY